MLQTARNKNIEIKIRKLLDSEFFGAYTSRFVWNGIEFSNLREYVPGDSVKRIDWKTTAKQNEVFIKNFEQERDMKILFLLDTSSSMQFWSRKTKKLDTLKEVFYTLWLSATSAWDSTAWYVINDNIHTFVDFKKWEENIVRIDSILSQSEQIEHTNTKKNTFIEHIKNLERLKISQSLVCIISDELDFDISSLRGIAARNQVLYCHISDDFENNLWDEWKELNLWYEKMSFSSSLMNHKKRETYTKIRTDTITQFKANLRKIHIDFLALSDTHDVVREFLKYFKNMR
jgi:uncharacterized protein (DUF58 family)